MTHIVPTPPAQDSLDRSEGARGATTRFAIVGASAFGLGLWMYALAPQLDILLLQNVQIFLGRALLVLGASSLWGIALSRGLEHVGGEGVLQRRYGAHNFTRVFMTLALIMLASGIYNALDPTTTTALNLFVLGLCLAHAVALSGIALYLARRDNTRRHELIAHE